MARGRKKAKPKPPRKPAARQRPARWICEPEQNPKRKHAWKNTYPGFVKIRGVKVGKCPKGLTNKRAEELLNSGLPYPMSRWGKPWPDRLYVIHDGAVYRAVPTVAGRSYHAFPELGEKLRRLPQPFLDRLMQRARELDCETEVRRWIRR